MLIHSQKWMMTATKSKTKNQKNKIHRVIRTHWLKCLHELKIQIWFSQRISPFNTETSYTTSTAQCKHSHTFTFTHIHRNAFRDIQYKYVRALARARYTFVPFASIDIHTKMVINSRRLGHYYLGVCVSRCDVCIYNTYALLGRPHHIHAIHRYRNAVAVVVLEFFLLFFFHFISSFHFIHSHCECICERARSSKQTSRYTNTA